MRAVTTITSRIAILALVLLAGAAAADPPVRAIRVATVTGPVSFLPSGESDWVQARVNRPLWTGDRLWTDRGARTELQIGGAVVFVGAESSIAVLDFDDDRAQFEVTQGTVDVYVRALGRNDAIEIDTPNLAFVVRAPGRYRIDVRPDGDSTGVAVLRGEAEAFGARAAYQLRTGQGYRFYGADLSDFDAEPVDRADAFTSWVASRIQRYERSQSARYVSPEMVGYADLDTYGSWRNVASYGPVWVPSRVDANWAPYRYGHWSWVEPWGWTWIDDAPWGFAPFHYGRWAHIDNRYWGWVPGPRNAAPVYAPALVAFVGGDNFRLSVSSGPGVAWFPLAPGEVYRPSYDASREYFTRVNVTNTVVNVTSVTNVYNNPRAANVRYVNVNNVNAVTAVPTQAFVQAQPVQRAAVRLDRGALQATQVVAAAPVAPGRASVGAAPPAQARPDARVFDRKVVARQAPPPAPPSFAQREDAMRQQPGKPLDRTEAARGAPPRQNVQVVQSATAPQPIPAAPPGERGKGRERDMRPPAQARPAAPSQPPPQVAQPGPGDRGKGNAERGRPEQAPPSAARAPEPKRPTVAAPPPAVQQPPAPPPPQAAQPDNRGRGNAQRAQPDTPPPPAARAPEPQPRPGVAAPPPVQQGASAPPQTGQPDNRERGNAKRADREAAPAQAQPPQQAQPAHDSKDSRGRGRDEDGPPGQRGKGRD